MVSSRERLENGAYERVAPHHAWCQESRVTNLALLNLMRHGDHHANPGRTYEELRYFPAAPVYPYDFSVMFMLSLWPSRFTRVANAVLDERRKVLLG